MRYPSNNFCIIRDLGRKHSSDDVSFWTQKILIGRGRPDDSINTPSYIVAWAHGVIIIMPDIAAV